MRDRVMVDIKCLASDMRVLGKSVEDATGYIRMYLVDSFGSDYWKENSETIIRNIKEAYAS